MAGRRTPICLASMHTHAIDARGIGGVVAIAVEDKMPCSHGFLLVTLAAAFAT